MQVSAKQNAVVDLIWASILYGLDVRGIKERLERLSRKGTCRIEFQQFELETRLCLPNGYDFRLLFCWLLRANLYVPCLSVEAIQSRFSYPIGCRVSA
ncbi:MAG: hypothetical protein ABS82_00565 [Rhodanobacter sp. SCN 67-45]|nr:MAG: hypothetical protein ABS82_00565 [Rhodanobacter sp. SCN 67-45]